MYVYYFPVKTEVITVLASLVANSQHLTAEGLTSDGEVHHLGGQVALGVSLLRSEVGRDLPLQPLAHVLGGLPGRTQPRDQVVGGYHAALPVAEGVGRGQARRGGEPAGRPVYRL